MTKEQKRAIEADAIKAAKEGKTPNDACPWPFATLEALQWLAAWSIAQVERK